LIQVLKCFLFLSILLVASTSSFSQRQITGRLVDKDTGKPIKEATVTIIGTSVETSVNILGYFQLSIDSIEEVTIKSPGYPELVARIPEVNSFKIELVKSSNAMEALFNDRSRKIYLNKFGVPTNRSDSQAYRLIIKHPAERSKFLVAEYFLNNDLKEIGTYSDSTTFIRNGFFTIFYKNGNKKEEGFYNDNYKIDKWVKWHSNNQIREESFFDNRDESNSEIKILNSWDSLGNQMVVNGFGTYTVLEADTLFEYSKGSISNGLKIGKWIGYFKSGQIYYEENYNAGKLTTGVSYGIHGDRYEYDEISDFNSTSFLKFISSNMRYPVQARRMGIEGKVFLQLQFDSKGQIDYAQVIQGIGGGCDEEALRVINKFNGSWPKFKLRGKPFIKSGPMTLPIMFKLG